MLPCFRLLGGRKGGEGEWEAAAAPGLLFWTQVPGAHVGANGGDLESTPTLRPVSAPCPEAPGVWTPP